MKSPIAYAIVLLIAMAFFVQPALAYTQMSSPFVDSCDFLFMAPTQFSDLIVLEYNNLNVATTSFDTLNIDFPAFADGMHLGSSTLNAGAGIGVNNALGVGSDASGIGLSGDNGLGSGIGTELTANVLPFGPVNLAFPDISQTAFDAYNYQRTYLFTDNSG